MERAEVKQRVLAIARDIYALAASSYGPTGRVKALQPNEDAPDALELTNNAERICTRIGSSECPIANVYLHIMKSRLRHHCDGGLFTMILSSKLQVMALDRELSNIPHHLVAQGYALALEWCLAYLDDPSCPIILPVDWSDTVALFAVMRAIIGSKPVVLTTATSDCIASLLPLLVEAFTSVLPFILEYPGESLPIRFIQNAAYAASSSTTSRLHKNTVMVDFERHAPLVYEQIPLHGVKVLLLSASVDPTNPADANADDSTGIVMESNWAYDGDTTYHELSSAIIALGVRVVISQKLLPEELLVCLAKRRVLAIHRLGISHMRAVELLTGATAIGDWRVVHSGRCSVQSLGFLSSVTVMDANYKTLLVLENNNQDSQSPSHAGRAWPVATLVLSVVHEYVYAELVHAIKSCFKRMVAMMEESEALAGAGCTEVHLAAWLRRNSQELVSMDSTRPLRDTQKAEAATLRQLRTVVHGFADALESIAVALDHGIHGLAGEVKELLATANHETLLSGLPDCEIYVLYGWDPVEGHVVPVATVAQHADSSSDSSANSDAEHAERCVLSAWILDSLQTKREALVSAVECATTLLRVASVIHTTP